MTDSVAHTLTWSTGSYVKLEEVVVGIDPRKVHAYNKHFNKATVPTSGFLIDLKDGNCYFLDLCGAWFARRRTITPFADHKIAMAVSKEVHAPMGTSANVNEKLAKKFSVELSNITTSGSIYCSRLRSVTNNALKDCLDFTVRLFSSQYTEHTSQILLRKEQVFLKESRRFEEFVMERLPLFVSWMKSIDLLMAARRDYQLFKQFVGQSDQEDQNNSAWYVERQLRINSSKY